jgi:hypothetical protein
LPAFGPIPLPLEVEFEWVPLLTLEAEPHLFRARLAKNRLRVKKNSQPSIFMFQSGAKNAKELFGIHGSMP